MTSGTLAFDEAVPRIVETNLACLRYHSSGVWFVSLLVALGYRFKTLF
jgi:hypothetical protein